MKSEDIQKITQTCTAWLAGDWRNIELPEDLGEENREFVEVLTRMRNRLMSSDVLEEEWSSNTDQLMEHLRRAEIMLETAKILTSTLELQPLLKAIVDSAGKMFDLSDAGVVFLYDEKKTMFKFVSSFGYPEPKGVFWLAPGEGGPGTVLTNQKPLLVKGKENVLSFYQIKNKKNQYLIDQLLKTNKTASESFICVPFISRGKMLGCLQLEHWSDSRTFTESDLRLLTRLADLIAIAIDNVMLWDELRLKEIHLHQMVGQLISAQEAERKRIARELHDDAGQTLTNILINLKSLENEIPDGHDVINSKIALIKTSIKDLMNRMKDLTFAIRPSILDDIGLAAALRLYTRNFSNQKEPKITLELEDIGKNLNSNIPIVLYRIAQEAINNALRYSEATKLKISLRKNHKNIILRIEDDGIGFNYDEIVKHPKESFGLQGMSERISVVNGNINIQSTIGKGTSIYACVPMDTYYREN